MKWFLKCIGRDYATFTGRAGRREFWYFVLFCVIFAIVAGLLDYWIFGPVFQPITWLFGLFTLVPSLAVTVRRFHDIDNSGWPLLWYFVAYFVWMIALVTAGISKLAMLLNDPASVWPSFFVFLLAIGALLFLVWNILFLVWCCLPGTKGENKYGAEPQ